jgi:hypothetical protein
MRKEGEVSREGNERMKRRSEEGLAGSEISRVFRWEGIRFTASVTLFPQISLLSFAFLPPPFKNRSLRHPLHKSRPLAQIIKMNKHINKI